MPGSFKYEDKFDLIQIKYTVEAYLDGMEKHMHIEKEIPVREYLFTN